MDLNKVLADRGISLLQQVLKLDICTFIFFWDFFVSFYLGPFSRFQNSSRRFLARSSVSDAVDARLDIADTDNTSSSLPFTLPPTLAGGLTWWGSGGDMFTLRGGVKDLASSPNRTLEAGLAGRASLSSLGGVLYPFRPDLLYPREAGFFFLESDTDFSKLSFKISVVTSRWCRRDVRVSRSSGVGDRPRSRIMSVPSSDVASVPEPARLSSEPVGERERSSVHASRLRGGDMLLALDRGCAVRFLLFSSAEEREPARSACSLLISSRLSREKCVPRALCA